MLSDTDTLAAAQKLNKFIVYRAYKEEEEVGKGKGEEEETG